MTGGGQQPLLARSPICARCRQFSRGWCSFRDGPVSPTGSCAAWTPRRDECRVPAAPLTEVLRRWRAHWEREWRPDRSRASAVLWLAQRTREPHIDPSGRGVEPQTIRNLLQGANRTVELRIADALLCAIGQPQALVAGAIPTMGSRCRC